MLESDPQLRAVMVEWTASLGLGQDKVPIRPLTSQDIVVKTAELMSSVSRGEYEPSVPIGFFAAATGYLFEQEQTVAPVLQLYRAFFNLPVGHEGAKLGDGFVSVAATIIAGQRDQNTRLSLLGISSDFLHDAINEGIELVYRQLQLAVALRQRGAVFEARQLADRLNDLFAWHINQDDTLRELYEDATRPPDLRIV